MKKNDPIFIKVPEVSLKSIEVPQVITDAVSTGVSKVRTARKDAITRVLEYEHTPIITAAAIGFLTGVIVGFMLSPVKSGVKIGCNNKAINNDFDNEYDEDIDDYGEDD